MCNRHTLHTRSHRRIAALEAEVTLLKSSGPPPSAAAPSGANENDTNEEVAQLKGENAQLVAKMREILVRYKAMQAQVKTASSAPASEDGAGGAGAEGTSENEQKLLGKLKEVVGKYKELQAAAKVND